MSQPEIGMLVLNANIGMTNVIESEDIDKILYNTFDSISKVLSKHCGPFGLLAMLPDPLNPTAQPAFTKDGINIVNAMEFASPMERYIKETVRYIGQRIESAAGDGTTSSMIIAVEVLRGLREYISAPTTRTNYTRMTIDYRKFVDDVVARFDKYVDTELYLKDPKILRNIAYHQAMTSSHGIEDLSNIIADMFETFPYECWSYITFSRERRETPTLYSMRWDDSDYTAKAHIFSNNLYNNKYRTGFEIEDTELLVVPHGLSITSMDYVNVKMELTRAIEQHRKLMVIVANSVDPHVRTELEQLFASSTGTPGDVSLFFINANTPLFNDLNGICAVAGVSHSDALQHYVRVRGVKATMLSGVLRLWGLFDRSRVVGNNHPDYNTPGTAIYELLTMLDEGIQHASANINAKNYDDTLTEYKRMYSTMRLIKRGELVIGGTSYDNEAAIDVVTDTLKAARATLRNGACLGGYNTLDAVLNDLVNDSTVSEVSQVIAQAFMRGIATVRSYTLNLAPVVYSIPIVDDKKLTFYTELTKHLQPGSTTIEATDSRVNITPLALLDDVVFQAYAKSRGGYVVDVLAGEISFLEDIVSTDRAVIVQPISVDKALLNRFGEVAIKFLFTDRIVVPGGVVVNNQTPKQ